MKSIEKRLGNPNQVDQVAIMIVNFSNFNKYGYGNYGGDMLQY